MEAQSTLFADPQDSWLHHVLAHIPSGSINVFDTQLRYLFAAGKGFGEVGLQPEEMVGKLLAEVFPPELVREVEPHYRRALDGHAVKFDLLVSDRWQTIHAAPIPNGQGEVETIVAVAQDSDERKRAETALEKKHTELLTIWESMTDGFFALDSGWCFTYVNAHGERILQRKREELLGKNVWLEFPEAADSELYERYHQAFAEQTAAHFEIFYAPLEVWVEVHAYPSPGGLAIYFHEINERKQAEEAERQSRRFLQSLLDALSSHIAVLDEQGVIISVNRPWQRFAAANGASAQCCGAGANYIAACESASGERSYEGPVVACAIRDIISGRRSKFEMEYPCHGPHDERWFNVRITRFDNELPVRVVVAHENVTTRKLAEKELAENAVLFRTVFESVQDAIVLTDDAGKCIDVNPAASQLLDRPCEEILLHRLADFTQADEQPVMAAAWEQFLREGQMSGESELLRPDGSSRTVSYCATANFLPGKHVCVLQDITKRKQAEQALQQERDFSTLVLDTVGSLVLVLDPQGRIVSFNRACEQLSGYSSEEMHGRYTDILLPPEEVPRLKGVFSNIVAGHFPNTEENYWVTRDGHRRLISWTNTALVDSEGTVTYVIATGLDITKRREAEESLRRAHDELQHANDLLEERVRARTAELASTNLDLQEQVAERQIAVGGLREVVEMLDQARQEAERANSAKSEFLSRMSHELRTPLNAILGFGQILEMRQLSPRDNEGVQQILASGRHLLQLIDEVLEISRIESGRVSLSMETVDIGLLVRDVVDLVQPLAAQRSITIINEAHDGQPAGQAPATGWRALADRQRLRQVMLNLLSNAVKYNKPGGSITITLREHQGRAGVLPSLLRIAVTDTGPGIAFEDQHKIFQPFERLARDKDNIEGTGIGLTLSKRIIELMDGRIGFNSRPGEGSTFWVELTMEQSGTHESPESPSHRPALPPAPIATPSPTAPPPAAVLYIDDNMANLGVMETLFEEVPQARLLTASRGSLGLEMARLHQPKVVLLDLHLTDMPGEEVLRQLRTGGATAGIPVVIVSADDTDQQISKLLASGAAQYLTKPLEIQRTLDVLQELLADTPRK